MKKKRSKKLSNIRKPIRSILICSGSEIKIEFRPNFRLSNSATFRFWARFFHLDFWARLRKLTFAQVSSFQQDQDFNGIFLVLADLRPWQTRTHCCGHIFADTNVSSFARMPARATFVADTNLCPWHKKCFCFCSQTFCIRNKCFPVCAGKETSWATMCPPQCVLVCQGLKPGNNSFLSVESKAFI